MTKNMKNTKLTRWDFNTRREADFYYGLKISALRKMGFLGGFKSSTIEYSFGFCKSGSLGVEVSLIGDLSKKWERELYVDHCLKDPTLPLNKYVRFTYTTTYSNGEKKDFDYKVQLTSAPCNYGGERYWFRCYFCNRRVGVLYKVDDYFKCRHCHYLTYSSKNCGYSVTSFDGLERLRREIKRPYYKGKMTKRHLRFLKKNAHTYQILYHFAYK